MPVGCNFCDPRMPASQREESEFDSSSSAKRLQEPSFAVKMKLQAQEVRGKSASGLN